MGEKLRLGWKKTSAPDGTLVNEKQQKVKNICKRTPATQCSIPNTKYHPEFHFHSHSTSSIMSSIRYEETEKKKEVDNSVCLTGYECVWVCVWVWGLHRYSTRVLGVLHPAATYHICTIESPAAGLVWSVCYKQCHFWCGPVDWIPDFGILYFLFALETHPPDAMVKRTVKS